MSQLHHPTARLAAVLGAALGLTLGTPAGAAVTHATCAASRLATPARLHESAIVTRPTFAQDANLTGTAGVRVDLGADGGVLGTYVVDSTGSRILDRDAERVARGSTYVAATTDGCTPIASSFKLLVDYTD